MYPKVSQFGKDRPTISHRLSKNWSVSECRVVLRKTDPWGTFQTVSRKACPLSKKVSYFQTFPHAKMPMKALREKKTEAVPHPLRDKNIYYPLCRTLSTLPWQEHPLSTLPRQEHLLSTVFLFLLYDQEVLMLFILNVLNDKKKNITKYKKKASGSSFSAPLNKKSLYMRQ